MAYDSSSSNNNNSVLATCVALLQWIVLTVVATVKRGVRFSCRACASSTASKSASAECIDLEAGGIAVATPKTVCSDEDQEEQDETARAFETIDVIVIADMQKPNENDDCERIEIVVVGESATDASESCTEQEEGEEAPPAAVGVDAVMAESESEDKDEEDEDTVDESENDSTPAHSAWSSEEKGDAAAIDTQLDFDLDTVSDAASSSSPVSSHSTTSEDDQDTKAPLMTDSTRIDVFEEILSRLDQQQGQREQEREMEPEPEPEFSETDSLDDNESKTPVGLDVKSQEQDDADSELDTVTDTSSPSSAAANSGSDCEFEEDDEESSTTTTSSSNSSTVDDSEDAEALYHEQQQPEQETTDNSSEEEEDQRVRMEPTAVDARTATTCLKSYHATITRVDNREHNRRLLEARAKVLRYSDSLEYKQVRAASLARRAALRKAAAAKPRFLF